MSSLIFPATPGAIHVRRSLLTRTDADEADDGKEFRVGKYPISRYRYSVEWNFLRQSAAFLEAQRIWRHFVMHGGRRESFLFVDPDDNAVTDHGFGVGDAVKTKFPLQRSPGGTWQDVLGTWPTYTKPRTNLCLRSQEFDAAAWTKTTGVTVSANQAIAPDGTLTADRVTYDGTGTIGSYRIYTGGDTPGPGATRTVSVWMKAAAPLTLRLGVNLGGGLTTCNVSTSWQRFSLVGTGDGVAGVQLLVYSNGGSNAAFTVDLWGGQIEAGSTATDYIATAAFTVRADPSYWTADQTTGALVAPGTSDGFEPVTEPDWATISIFKDGVAQAPGTAFTFTAGGLVTFAAAPASGSVLSWTGNFYRRVRFDDDEADFERIVAEVKRGAIELVSVV